MEPMSSLAEPPTLPEELETMMGALKRHHGEHCTETVPAGFCLDVAHGYADVGMNVRNDHITLLNIAIPHLFELHLKNTDELYNATFGFSENERKRGLVDMVQIVHLLHQQTDHIPVDTLVGYLEIGGPKLGRDYSDPLLERQLRDSLGYLKEVFR